MGGKISQHTNKILRSNLTLKKVKEKGKLNKNKRDDGSCQRM